ncbi:hypothetical protein JCM16163A_41260 [Paenibacillus sp. YK5]
MTMYKIQVGNFPLSDAYPLLEAERIKAKLQPCVNDEIQLIPVDEEFLELQAMEGGNRD